MKKRILGLLLALCLVVGLLPLTAAAAQPNGRFYYLDYDGNSRVGGAYVTMTEGMNPVYLINRSLTSADANYTDGTKTNIYTLKVTEVPADNYIKLEYPTGGVATVTLHNVTIKNLFGIAVGWYKVNNSTNANYVNNASYNIVLEGTNTIENIGTTYSAFKANTSGDVTISGSGSLTLSSDIVSKDFGVLSTLSNLTLDNTNVTVICPETYGKANAVTTTAGNITVKGGTLNVIGIDDPSTTHAEGKTSGGERNGETMYSAISVGKADLAITTSDTTEVGGNLTIQDMAKVTVMGSPYQTALVKTAGTFTIKDSDVEIGLAGKLNSSTMLTAAPTLTYTGNYTAVASTTACSYASATVTAPADTVAYAEADVATYKYFKVTHNCVSAADDKDCTTPNTCDLCGEPLGTAQTAHTPKADDGDCTTAVLCANPGCEQIVTPAAAAHTPEADDGDCTTAIKCATCGKETTPAAASHTAPANRTSCDVAADCTVCGTQIPAGQHTGGAATCKDKAVCTVCSQPYGELADHTGGTATCKDKAVCTVCNQPYGELSTEHTPEADDKDCTTAVKCSVCGGEAIAAKEHKYTNALDTTCDNAPCEHTRVVEPKPVFSVSFDTSSASGGNISSGAGKATVIMNAGDATKYFVTSNHDTAAEKKFFAKEQKDAAKIAAGEWNIKVEYPADGIPTVTLKNAKIVSKYGVLFGGWDAANEGPVKLVLEGDNIIAAEYSYKSALQFLFKGDKGAATIEGPGSLLVSTNCHGGESSKMGAVLVMNGSLTLDKANLTVLTSEEWGCSYGVVVDKGDMTMKGGSLKIVGYDNANTTHYEGRDSGYNLNANASYGGIAVFKTDDAATNGNLIVEGGAKVTVAVSICKNTNNAGKDAVLTQGKFTIKDSEVEIGLIGKCLEGSKLFSAKPTLEFANNAYTVTATKTKKPTPTLVDYEYDQYTKDMTALAPDMTKAVDWAETTGLGSITYFKVVAGGSGSGSGTGTGTGSGSGSNNPNTGDVSILLTAGIALASAVGFGGVTILRKKEN